MRGGSCWLLALWTGCGFTAIQNPANLTSSDLAGADFSGSDLTPPPESDLATADLSVSLCAGPLLLVTVENLKNPASNGGRVAALGLGDGTALPTFCTTLSGGGLMTQQPFSAALVDGKLAVMGRDALQLIELASDSILWSKPVTGNDFPVDVFPLTHPDGRKLVAAGWGSTLTSGTAIRRVDSWDAGGTAVKSWGLNAQDLPLGLSVNGMTAYPQAPTHFLALDPINHQWAWEVDPWGATKTALFGEATGNPITIFATKWQSATRTAWVDATSPTAVFYNNDTASAGILGPIACKGCTLLHVTPDPTTNLRFFGLCEGPGVDSRRVVRFSAGAGACDTVLEGAQFGAESRLSRLGQ
jgi:hypothetical protein